MLTNIVQPVRTLLRRPGYALTVIATLALGIGAATAVFALVHGILLSSLPFPDAERLVLIRNENAGGTWNTSVVDHQALGGPSTTLESVASMRAGEALIGSGERAHWVDARFVTAAYFDVLGLKPQRGRGFVPGEDKPEAANTVVIGQDFAETEFAGADPIGKTVLIDGQAHTVVGVMPPGVESWPVMRGELWPILKLAEPERRGPFFLGTVARLKPGVTLEVAAADLEAASRRLFPIWQQGFQDESARLAPFSLHQMVVGGTQEFLWVAFAAVVVVLLIALVNNANLMLMRIAQRAQDLGVRAALGASRMRLARLLMAENIVLVAMGAGAGIALATVLLAQYRALGPAVPRIAEVGMSADVLAFAGGLALLSALVFCLLPLMPRAIVAAGSTLQSRGASSGRDPQRVRDGLVVLEFALAFPLLIAAGLLVDSLMRLQRVDPGFDADRILTASVRLPEAAYADPAARLAFWNRALPALRQLPGVKGAGLAGVMPPNCGCYNNFDLLARPAGTDSQPSSPWIPVDGGWFETLGVRLLEGRTFDARDTPDSPFVLLVSESWARHYFPGESAVGKQLHEGGNTEQVQTIIGVVSDVKFDGLQASGDAVFAPISQGWGGNSLYAILRTSTEPLAMATPMRRALQQIDPTLVPTEVAAMDTLLRDSLGGQRHWAAVIAGFALSAVILAAVGVFGVLAYQVTNREKEIGIRQALGADRRRIVRMVLRRGLGCALVGVAVGAVLAAFLTRGLQSLLFEVSRADPATWLAAGVLLLLVGLAACWLPARRASRIDPLVALRQE